jgi:hypothetical protein
MNSPKEMRNFEWEPLLMKILKIICCAMEDHLSANRWVIAKKAITFRVQEDKQYLALKYKL